MQLDLHDRKTQLGVALVALGTLTLFSNAGLFSGLFSFLAHLVGLALFGAAGLWVLDVHRKDPSRVWALPVGTGLLGLAVETLELPWTGGAFLGAIGLGFLAIYLTDTRRERWWAIIPAGVLLTLGAIATWEDVLRGTGDATGTILLVGLAATFAALYLIPAIQKRWAIWPALALGVAAVLTIGSSGGWVAPVLLVGLGAFLLTRQSRPSDIESTVRTTDGPSGSVGIDENAEDGNGGPAGPG